MNMKTVKGLLKSGLAVAGLIFGLGVANVYADGSEPIMLNPDGTAFVAPAASADGLDGIASGAFPRFYLSAPGTGNVAGNGYADEDIMLYNSGPGTWSKAFDGTNKGLADGADIDALAIINNSGYLSYLMSFEAPTAVPGQGTVDDSDVVRFDTWNSAWSMYLDGSTAGLTTNAEDIDALSFSAGGYLVVSTLGNYTVANMEGGNLTGNDKDLILFVNRPAGTWTKWLQGSTIGMGSANDIKGVSFVRYNEAVIKDGRYIVGQAGWNLPNGVAIGANDVSEQLWFQNGSTEYYKRLDASDLGFPKIDAIEVLK
jgi:hypothetical protein